MRFDGQVALITGAGRGLGRSYALELAARGAAVVVNDIGTALNGDGGGRGPADEVVAQILANGGRAVADVHSVADAASAAQIVATALDEFGRLDIIVNNAGILDDRALHKMTPAQAGPVIQTHLMGALNVSIPAWTVFREQQYGRIVNTTSTAGLFGNFGQSGYAAAKAGIVGLTKVQAIEGAKYGIRANALAPGAVTRMTPDGVVAQPERLAPELVAPVVVYLSHSTCSLTGEVLRASGGHVARIFIGVTAGIEDDALTPEAIAERIDAIMDTGQFTIPASALDNMRVAT
ncbi:3-hydroxyacyl-CoA dehydrogenase [Mycolicibacterium rhodesiae JS60]|nr:3-hydroxyacyl-CoA dehydrogenase [Mycolicibacterium rhodesiae JS60]